MKFFFFEFSEAKNSKLPFMVGANTTEWVSEFSYLGSLVPDNGRMDAYASDLPFSENRRR